jgi:hypothetical protein
MAKGYRAFTVAGFGGRESYVVPTQYNYLGIEIPDTSLERVGLPVPEGFVSYFVHHEMIVDQIGRAKDISFTQFAAPFEFHVHFRKSDGLLLVPAPKRVCKSLIRNLEQGDVLHATHYLVDFERLRPNVDCVKGAWFKFRQPDLRTSGHFGNHVDRSPAYKEALQLGEMSGLYLLHDFCGQLVQVQITSDYGVVLYNTYSELRTELSVVLSVLGMLNEVSAVARVESKKAALKKLSGLGKEKTRESPVPLSEILEENEQ